MKYFKYFKQIYDLDIPNCTVCDMYHAHFAKLFDRIARSQRFDLKEYINQASITGEPILELGCGTGRVTLRLAEAGYSITGVDISGDMLDILNEKLKKRSSEIVDRVELYNYNMFKISLKKKYKLIILPGSTLSLIEDSEVEKLFQTVYQHLDTGGRFIFDYKIYEKEEYFNHDEMTTFTWDQDNGVKELFIMGQYLNDTKSKITVNCYAEVIDYDKTQYYLGSSTRSIISTDEILNLIIEKTDFKILHTRFFEEKNTNKTKFIVLEKK